MRIIQPWALMCGLAGIAAMDVHAPAQAQAVQPPAVTVLSPSNPAGGGAAAPMTNIAPPPVPLPAIPASPAPVVPTAPGAAHPGMSIAPIGDICRNLTADEKAANALCKGR